MARRRAQLTNSRANRLRKERLKKAGSGITTKLTKSPVRKAAVAVTVESETESEESIDDGNAAYVPPPSTKLADESSSDESSDSGSECECKHKKNIEDSKSEPVNVVDEVQGRRKLNGGKVEALVHYKGQLASVRHWIPLDKLSDDDLVIADEFMVRDRTFNFVWQYYVDDNVDGKPNAWYDMSYSKDIESLWQDKDSKNVWSMLVRPSVGKYSYNVDIDRLVQTNIQTGRSRAIRRIAGTLKKKN